MAKRDMRRAATPLLDWGEQLRAAKYRRRIIGRRVAVTGIGVTLLGLTMAFPPAPRLFWAPGTFPATSGKVQQAAGFTAYFQ